MLNTIKMLLSITDTSKDNLLTILISQAKAEIVNYCHVKDLSGTDALICQMVVYRYNQLGTEGVTSEDFSGVEYDYSTDYPENIIRQLKSFRRVQVV